MAYLKRLRQRVGHMPLILTSASGALVNDQGQVLLQERADTRDWSFPGGYMEYGESFRQTVVREYLEDAGLRVKPIKLLGIFDSDEYTYPNGDVVQPINAFYLVRPTDNLRRPPKVTETTRVQFFELTEHPHFFNDQHLEMWQRLGQCLRDHE